jgi:hypothetical protein
MLLVHITYLMWWLLLRWFVETTMQQLCMRVGAGVTCAQHAVGAHHTFI